MGAHLVGRGGFGVGIDQVDLLLMGELAKGPLLPNSKKEMIGQIVRDLEPAIPQRHEFTRT